VTAARTFCSDISRENDEPLGATASRIDRWLLVEYRGLWSSDALVGSGLSDQVKARLRELRAVHPRTRLLLIRRPDRRRHPTLAVYVADSREGNESLGRLEIGHHEELRRLDPWTTATQIDEPLFLACTHGKHDPCCARYGRPLFDGLSEQLDAESAWQTTHVGGDRFAGNLVCLPYGLYYGRLDRPGAAAVLDELLAERIHLDPYRGRSCYSFAVQAAERAVRSDTGLTGLDDLRFVASHRRDDGAWTVAIAARGRGIEEVDLREELGELVHLTCSAEELRRPRRFVVTGRRVRPAT
jgi:hypothetical protein